MQKLSGFIKNFWWVVLIAIFGLGFLIFFIRWYLSKQALKNLPQQTYAFLEEFDGLSTRHPINKTTICIGRNKDNDICLVNDSISSHHAEIHRRRDGTFSIVDLGSTNGVLVNNIKITQLGIKDGDLIELGEVKLNFSLN
jgi:pSer/pThr/pTyr-binding forkhead associated (FHA) protein